MKKIYTKNDLCIYKLDTRRVSTFILQKDGKNTLWDTSMNYEMKKIRKAFGELGISKLDAVFISHAHTDHAANAAEISRVYGAKVYVHRNGIERLRCGRCPVPKGMNISGKLVEYLAQKYKNIYDFSLIDRCDAEELHDEVVKGLLGNGAELIYTPGHTADSVSLVIDREIALVGDIFVNMFTEFYPPFADCPELIAESWEKLVRLGCGLYYPGHGDAATLKRLKRASLELRFRGDER